MGGVKGAKGTVGAMSETVQFTVLLAKSSGASDGVFSHGAVYWKL